MQSKHIIINILLVKFEYPITLNNKYYIYIYIFNIIVYSHISKYKNQNIN